MKRIGEAVVIIVGGGLFLAATNLFAPFLSYAISFTVGFVAVVRIFLTPGILTWRRDINLFSVLLLALSFAWLTKWLICVLLAPQQVTCRYDYFRGDIFANVAIIMLPVMLFWSWVRFRLLKDKITHRKN